MQKKSRKKSTTPKPILHKWLIEQMQKEYRKKTKKLYLQIKNKLAKHQNASVSRVPTRPYANARQGTNANGRKLLTQVYRKKAKKLHLQTKKKLAKQRKKTKQKQTRNKLARNLLKTRKGEAMLRKAKALHRQ